MALSYINTATYDSWNTDSIVINKPTNTADWDIMFAVIISWGYNVASVPSWWNLIWNSYNNCYYKLYYKIASSEWANYTRWLAAWWEAAWWRIFTYRWWFDTADAIDVVSDTVYSTSDTTCRAASMIVSAINSPLLYLWCRNGWWTTSFTKPSVPTTDWTENYDNYNPTSNNGYTACSMTWTSNWATWNIDWTMNLSTNGKHAFAVALNPPSTWNPWAFFQMF